MSKKLEKPIHLHLIVTEDVIAVVDRWRSKHIPTPNRSNAIRTMLLTYKEQDSMKKDETS